MRHLLVGCIEQSRAFGGAHEPGNFTRMDKRGSSGALGETLSCTHARTVRAKIADGISTSRYTGIKTRHLEILRDQSRADALLMALIGVKSFNVPTLTAAEHIDLVDFTGREIHAGKRGKIEASEPRALRKLGLDKDRWRTRVKGIGSGYWRVVGELEELIDKAKEMAQRTLFGTGLARILSKI